MTDFLFPELEEDARRKREALLHSEQAAPPADARGWQLRAVSDLPELSAGWNEPFPPKRDWSVHHYYRERRSICKKYSYSTAYPPKPHFQIVNSGERFYRSIHTDYLCKTCLTHVLMEVIPQDHTGVTQVVSIFDQQPFQIYIGGLSRRYLLPESKWANPDPAARKKPTEQMIQNYLRHILSRPDLVAALPEIKGRILACNCKNSSSNVHCHGNVLVQLLEGEGLTTVRLHAVRK